jgi:hypothetical protein
LHWITVFDIHQTSNLSSIVLAGVLGALALATGAGAVSGFRPPADAGSRRFGTMLAFVSSLFLLFAISAISDLRRNIDAGYALDAGKVEHVEGEITDIQRGATGSYGRTTGTLAAFKIGQLWFVSPLPGRCKLQVGDSASVSYLASNGSRLTPLIVRMAMLHACNGRSLPP